MIVSLAFLAVLAAGSPDDQKAMESWRPHLVLMGEYHLILSACRDHLGASFDEDLDLTKQPRFLQELFAKAQLEGLKDRGKYSFKVCNATIPKLQDEIRLRWLASPPLGADPSAGPFSRKRADLESRPSRNTNTVLTRDTIMVFLRSITARLAPPGARETAGLMGAHRASEPQGLLPALRR